jgi:hypothetical protein
MIWKEFEVIVVRLSAYYSENFVEELIEVKGNLCQDLVSYLRFRQDSIRLQAQRATLPYIIGNLKMSKGQLKVKGFLPRSQSLAFLTYILQFYGHCLY